MALNIKNIEVERLAREVAELTGESKTQAILQALRERKDRLAPAVVRERRLAEVLGWLETEVWPKIDQKYLGVGISQAEQDEILGYADDSI